MPKAEPWRTVSMTDDCTKLRLVDQTRLPNELVWLEISELEEVWQAIKTLAVRGAPAIGVAAVVYFALILFTRAISREDLSLMPKGDKIAKVLHIQ